MAKDIESFARELASSAEFLQFVSNLAVAQARADAKHLIEATAMARSSAPSRTMGRKPRHDGSEP